LHFKRLFPLGLLVLLLLTLNGNSIKTPRSINKEQIAKQITLKQESTTNNGENKINKTVENREGYWCVMEVTGYVGGQLTASGTKPVRGRSVAAPPEIPFGTRIFIDHPYFKDWSGDAQTTCNCS